MTSGMRRGIGGTLVGIGGVSIFNSAEAFALSPYWLGGSILIFGVLMLILGIRMFRRAQVDDPASNAAGYEAQRERYELMQERENERHEAGVPNRMRTPPVRRTSSRTEKVEGQR